MSATSVLTILYRKSLDCSFQTGDYEEVKLTWELLSKAERDPTTIHIMYQVSLRDSDFDTGSSCCPLTHIQVLTTDSRECPGFPDRARKWRASLCSGCRDCSSNNILSASTRGSSECPGTYKVSDRIEEKTIQF